MWARFKKATAGKADHDTLRRLNLACASDDPTTVLSILESYPGIDPAARHSARHPSPLGASCLTGSLSCVRAIVESKRASPSAVENATGRTPLHYAARGGDPGVVTYLITMGATPLVAEKDGSRPLHLAARGGHAEIISLLVNMQNADINAVDLNGQSALHVACEVGHRAAVSALIKCGSNSNLADGNGDTPLMWAVYVGHEGVVDELLSSARTSLEIVNDYGWSSLHIAAYAGRLNILRKLIEVRSDARNDEPDYDCLTHAGHSLLHAACEGGREDIVRWLLAHGANVAVAGVDDAKTPLHVACAGGHPACVIALAGGGGEEHLNDNGISQGLSVEDISVVDSSGTSPFVAALESGGESLRALVTITKIILERCDHDAHGDPSNVTNDMIAEALGVSVDEVTRINLHPEGSSQESKDAALSDTHTKPPSQQHVATSGMPSTVEEVTESDENEEDPARVDEDEYLYGEYEVGNFEQQQHQQHQQQNIQLLHPHDGHSGRYPISQGTSSVDSRSVAGESEASSDSDTSSLPTMYIQRTQSTDNTSHFSSSRLPSTGQGSLRPVSGERTTYVSGSSRPQAAGAGGAAQANSSGWSLGPSVANPGGGANRPVRPGSNHSSMSSISIYEDARSRPSSATSDRSWGSNPALDMAAPRMTPDLEFEYSGVINEFKAPLPRVGVMGRRASGGTLMNLSSGGISASPGAPGMQGARLYSANAEQPVILPRRGSCHQDEEDGSADNKDGHDDGSTPIAAGNIYNI